MISDFLSFRQSQFSTVVTIIAIIYLIIALLLIVEYVRCRVYFGWLTQHEDESETVSGTVAVTNFMPAKKRLTVRYITMRGLKLYKDLSRDVPYWSVREFERGDEVQVTYRRSHPEQAYLVPYRQQKLKGVRRGLVILPAVFVLISLVTLYIVAGMLQTHSTL